MDRQEARRSVDPETCARVPLIDYERGSVVSNRGRRNKSGLTPAIVQNLNRQGMSGAEGARKYGVTRAYWSKLLRSTEGFTKTADEIAREWMPIWVPDGPHACRPYRNMRLHALRSVDHDAFERVERGDTLLRGFYARLSDYELVVEYDPNIPPNRAASTGFFAYRPREASDGDLIIRPNDYTHGLDDVNMREFWRLPLESSWP